MAQSEFPRMARWFVAGIGFKMVEKLVETALMPFLGRARRWIARHSERTARRLRLA